jgi:hypothetical protein
MLDAIDLGIANDGQRAGHEQAAQIGAYSHLTPPHATRGPPRPALLRYVGLRDAGLGSIRGVILGREKGSHLDAI